MGWTTIETETETIVLISSESPCPCTSISGAVTSESCTTQSSTILPAEIGTSSLISTSFTTVTVVPNIYTTKTKTTGQSLLSETSTVPSPPAQETTSTINVSTSDLSTPEIIVISIVSGVVLLLISYIAYHVLAIQAQLRNWLSSRWPRDPPDWWFGTDHPRRPGPDNDGGRLYYRRHRRKRYPHRRDSPGRRFRYQDDRPGPKPSDGGKGIFPVEIMVDEKRDRRRQPIILEEPDRRRQPIILEEPGRRRQPIILEEPDRQPQPIILEEPDRERQPIILEELGRQDRPHTIPLERRQQSAQSTRGRSPDVVVYEDSGPERRYDRIVRETSRRAEVSRPTSRVRERDETMIIS